MKEFTNSLSSEIFNLTYRYQEESLDQLFKRVATNLASVEQDSKKWANRFYETLKDFKFVPGGRILSNAGAEYKGTTYINCFVDGFEGEHRDSMQGIMDALKRQALILKSEGGYGINMDTIRPRGMYVEGIGNETPGAVKMLEMWDTQSDVITAGSGKTSTKKNSKKKIRKGAQMCTLSCWHKDIEEFITAKQTPGRLSKFNMSVLITDKFMDAVINHESWHLEHPDIYSDQKFDYDNKIYTVKQLYDKYWDGNLEKWKQSGWPTKILKTYKDANELWDLIMKSTYNRNEPGVLFVDTVNRMNNLYYEEFIHATNPCGEQILPDSGGVCLLGSLNMTQFVRPDRKDFDYDKLKKYIPNIVRMMDNVNDLTYVPLDKQKQNIRDKRRIGLGVMGYASALLYMKIPYGSKKALELTDKFMNFYTNEIYKQSSLLANEKGSFPLYDQEKYLAGNFIKTLDKSTQEMIRSNGIRNSHCTSIQPTGNSSIFANSVSGGLEPIFMSEYYRTAIIPEAPTGLELPRNIDWSNKKFDLKTDDNDWKWITEGDENILSCKYKNTVYKIDPNRGLTKVYLQEDYGVRKLKEQNEWNPEADWAVTTTDLKAEAHIDTMEVFSRYVDSAISKTINLPESYSYKDFKDIYLRMYHTGTIKGGTTYRAGTMSNVLDSIDKKDKQSGIINTQAPKRPKTIDCDIYHTTALGKKWVVLVGMLDNDPYEVWAFKSENLKLSKNLTQAKLTKIKKDYYNLNIEGVIEIENIKEFFDRDEQEVVTLLLSWGLRHGGGIEHAVKTLNKSGQSIVSFSKAIARTLKRYIKEDDQIAKTCPECGQQTLVLTEGCETCSNCGYSAC